MADLVTPVVDATQTPAPQAEGAPVVKNLDAGAYGRMMAGQPANGETAPETPPAPAPVPTVTETVAQEENWFASDAPAEEVVTDSSTPVATPAVYQQLATELGIDLPTENVEETLLNTVKGIREVVQTDPYRAEDTAIAQNNYRLALTDDQLLFVDKVTRLGKDLSHEDIEELISKMAPDQFQREVESIRTALETDNTNRIANKATLEKQAVADRIAAEKASKAELATQTNLFNEALAAYKVDDKVISPRLQQEISRLVLSGELAKYLNSPEGLIEAAMAMPKLKQMYLSARDSRVAQKAVSDSLKKIDGQQLQIGNGNFVTPGIRTLSAAEYGRTQKQ